MQDDKTLEEFQICELEDRVEFGLCGGGGGGGGNGEPGCRSNLTDQVCVRS
jgi:hypothetical protein